MKSTRSRKGFPHLRLLVSIFPVLVLLVSCASTTKHLEATDLKNEAKAGICFSGEGQMTFEMGSNSYRMRYEGKLRAREKIWDLALFPRGGAEERIQIAWISGVGEVKGPLVKRLFREVRHLDDKEKVKQSRIFLGYVGDMIRLYIDIKDEVPEIFCETFVDEKTSTIIEKCKNAVTGSILEKTVIKTGSVWVFRPDNDHYVEMTGSAPVSGLYSKFSFIFNGVDMKKEAGKRWRVNVDVSECHQRN